MQSENPRPTDENEPESPQPIPGEPVDGSTSHAALSSTLDETESPAGDGSPERDVIPAAQQFSSPEHMPAPTVIAPGNNGAQEISENLVSPSVSSEKPSEQLAEPTATPTPDFFRRPGAPPGAETPDQESSPTPDSGSQDSGPPMTPSPMTSSLQAQQEPQSFHSSAAPVTPVATQAPPRAAQTATAKKSEAPGEPKGLLDLHDSEELMFEVDSGDDGRFVLTSHRLIYQGRAAEGALFSTAAIEDVTAIEFRRRSRDSRSAWWGVVGLVAAIAVWQVTTNETVGAVAGGIVAGISLLLLADYWFRPAGLTLRFGTPGGNVEGPVSGKRVREAERLAARVQQMKMPHSDRGTRKHGHPPGGSPGLQ